jgi:hypothetical protein
MRPKELLSQYFSGLIGAKELKIRLAEDSSREAREVLEMLKVEEISRRTLSNFQPQTNAHERLVEQVASVESWIQPSRRQNTGTWSISWLSNSTPAFDVVGHEGVVRKKKKKKFGSKKKSRHHTRGNQ